MSEFIIITPPAAGDPTRLQAFALPVIADLNSLQGAATTTLGIPNGSFETGTGADSAPVGWDLAIAAGNSTSFGTSTADTENGAQSFKMTTPGSITGGVTLISTNFIICTEAVSILLSWYYKSSTAGISNKVEVLWYDSAEGLLSTDTLFTSTSNPTAWTVGRVVMLPPANARLFKIKITGVNNSTAGTAFWDGFVIQNQALGTETLLNIFEW